MKKIVMQLASLRPRNALAILARRRRAGAHKQQQAKRGQAASDKDLVQRLREAGL